MTRQEFDTELQAHIKRCGGLKAIRETTESAAEYGETLWNRYKDRPFDVFKIACREVERAFRLPYNN